MNQTIPQLYLLHYGHGQSSDPKENMI